MSPRALKTEPPTYERVEPRYFGLAPHLLAATLGGIALLAGVLLLASGSVAVGTLLVVLGLLLAALFAEQARHRRASPVDRVAAGAVDSSLALAGFTRATAGVWAGAGRDAARLRIEARRLARRRAGLQAALGAAAYAEDEDRVRDLRAGMAALDDELHRCEDGARAAFERARQRTKHERQAVASTQIRRPTR
jgi:hypothetical protein